MDSTDPTSKQDAYLLCFLTPRQLKLLEAVIWLRNLVFFWERADEKVDPTVRSHNLGPK